ncbi:MAG: MFS transporter [Anaerolineae bacterium]|nr:MFS transporter [Anaerolineae bacterium]
MRMQTEKLTARQLRDEMMEGLRYIRRNDLLWRLMLAGAASMLGLGAVIILGTVQIQDVYNIQASGIGALLSVLGLGMVVGGAAVATPWAHIYPAPFVGVSMVLLGSSLALFPFLGDFRLALVAIFITGASLISLRSVVSALMQMNVPDDRRGRVESANNVVMAASYNASLIATGALGIAIAPSFLFPLAGAFVLAAGVLAFQSIRRLPSPSVNY